ncbi:hypothetical protein SK128_013757, partial [Halocaridina rubra]
MMEAGWRKVEENPLRVGKDKVDELLKSHDMPLTNGELQGQDEAESLEALLQEEEEDEEREEER